jgi:hypothetical protein
MIKTDILDILVNQVIEIKRDDPTADSSTLETQIDQLVYHLYGLTYEEVKVIDPDFGLSEEEYAGMKNEE